MIVKFIDAPGTPGGKAVALCDDAGEMVPMQISATLTNSVGDYPEITVTLRIDGDKVRIAD